MTNRPNILLFLTDDHGAWATGCYGNREVRSPVLDRLSREGTRFDRAYTPSPVCSPGRACLLTGRTPSEVGIHDWLQESDGQVAGRDWLRDETTLPERLSRAGYLCGLAGKWHLGNSHQVPRGFDWCFGLPGHQGAHIETYTYHLNGEPVTLTGNKTRLITDHALDFLEAAPADRPFFLNVGYLATHSPWSNQDPDLTASYADATFENIPQYLPHPWVKNEGLPFGDGYTSPDGWTNADCRSRYAAYYAAVTDMDRNIGRILAKLHDQRRLDNTLVIYTSDHGVTLGHHGFWGKGNSKRPLNMYDTCLRIPLLIRWPGVVAAGQVVDHCVDHYDTFQTICEWAQVNSHQHGSPGRSYRALAIGESIADWDDTRYGEYGDLRMIRTPEWKLVRRYPSRPDDLFNLVKDPGETRNLATHPGLLDIKTDLQARLDRFYATHDNPTTSGLRVRTLARHNNAEAWRDGLREARGLQREPPDNHLRAAKLGGTSREPIHE